MTISLPSKWVKKNNLKSGDELELAEQDDNLVVSAERKEVVRTFQFDAATKGVMTNRAILQAYLLGYDEIKISYTDPLALTKIKKIVPELIGFEIIQESTKSCTLKELTGINQLEFDSIFRRLFRIIAGISEESGSAVEKNDRAMLENLISRDIDVNKFSNLCVRYLNKVGHPETERTSAYLILCQNLERIGDGYKEILRYMMENDKKMSEEYLKIFKKINSLFAKCYEYTFELKNEKAIEIASLFESLNKEIDGKNFGDLRLMSQMKSLLRDVITIVGLQAAFSN